MSHRPAGEDINIVGLTCDSRRVQRGFLFAALPGIRTDGRSFVAEAVERGAAAILGPPGTPIDPRHRAVHLVSDENPRRLFALLAARFYGAQPRTIAAVTGTNGKTSVVGFLRQIWTELGRQAASLGTLGVIAPDLKNPGNLTTPDPVELHKTLSELAGRGIECVAMEASSHGLAQYRLDGVRLAAAAFTNLTRDHLDYHGSMEAYLAAKLRLFSTVMAPGGAAVLNADASYFDAVHAACASRGHRIFTYGARGREIRLDGVRSLAQGQRLKLTVEGRAYEVPLSILGAFQAENALAALGLALALGEDRDRAVAALAGLRGEPGRIQLVGRHPNGAPIYVDYAHTPDALAAMLQALRPHAKDRLVLVFGCGGDRDPGKRPEMGHIAAALADLVIVTDDNPRGEDPVEIRRQILSACRGGREFGDRRQAIGAAVAGLGPGDLLVVAGKGHERGQIVGTEVRPFDDAEAVAASLRELES